jgi:MFS family permease
MIASDAAQTPAPAIADMDRKRARRTVVAICGMLYYQGYTMAINGIGAPWIAKSFSLGESGIARLYAWISISALGALALSRLADRIGRRRVLLTCMVATPLSALGAALSQNIVLFTVCEILLYAFIGATIASSIVMLAEELPIAQRAKGQSYGGLALTLGAGLCVLLMPFLDHGGYSWRWLLVLSAAGLTGLPLVIGALPESHRWEHAAASGATGTSGFADAFRQRYRRRTAPIMFCALLGATTGTAINSWSYFHAVSVVGLPSGMASLVVLIGGGLGMTGFPLGAWGCERVGRVPTVVTCGLLVTAGALFFYWGPPAHFAFPALWLGVGFCWFAVGVNGAMVGGNAAATELFPTALRSTMIGWFTLINALGALAAQSAIALLANPLGGLSNVVGYLAMLATPSAIIFGLFIEETRGLSLEVAAKEETGTGG